MKKGTMINIVLVSVLIIGLSLVLYPSLADYWNSFVQSRAVASYVEVLDNINNEEYRKMIDDAIEYNSSLVDMNNAYLLSDEQKEKYWSLLDVSGSGVMGVIKIPSIAVELPVYHGTSDEVLQVAVGHLDWTSLPVGGESTHSVVSGHRGLMSAKIFTDLDQLVIGDYFMMNVLNEVLTYQVDQIRIVQPNQTDDLLIEKGKDYFTLVTCTPYGINSHRLLIRGHRVANIEEAQEVRITGDAMVIERLVVVPFLLVPILTVMLIMLLISAKRTRESIMIRKEIDNEK